MNSSPVPWREVFTDEATHTITGNVKIYESFPIPQLQTERRVWIYLPMSYNGILEKQIRVDVIPGGTHHDPHGACCFLKCIDGCYSHRSYT
ncbi:hypothetical protein ACX12E_21480 [Paenibacillus vandeheii]